MDCRVGTAGWSVPAAVRDDFPATGTALERYAGRFGGVEINSCFYKSHKLATYARWSASVPDDFRFALKLPKTITHDRRLIDVEDDLARFRIESDGLGGKRGPILIQLPPSLAFRHDEVGFFLAKIGGLFPGRLVCEPRHASWFTPAADALLRDHGVARVAADPPMAGSDGEPGGWLGLVYRRLHGAPRTYYSDYAPDRLAAIAAAIAADLKRGVGVWCIFDNTALGHATGNALALQSAL